MIIILVEHQSTLNPNMTYRLLQYIMLTLNKIITEEKLYSEQPIKLPTPKFIVLYNGKKKMKPVEITTLSSLYADNTHTELDEGIDFYLEAKVKWIDINAEENKELVEKCRILNEYVVFVNKVTEFNEECGDLTEAIMKAVEYCINNSVLKDFLETYTREVAELFAQEYKVDLHMEARYNDGRVEGRVEREQEIIRSLFESGLAPDFISQTLKIPESQVLAEIASVHG